MYANNIIIAKDTLGNEWEFGNLSCASSSENLSYANLTDIKWSGTELTLSHNGVTRSFYFNTPTDAAHMAEIIKSVSQNPEKYNRPDNITSGDAYLENADIRSLLVETVIHQRNIDKKQLPPSSIFGLQLLSCQLLLVYWFPSVLYIRYQPPMITMEILKLTISSKTKARKMKPKRTIPMKTKTRN